MLLLSARFRRLPFYGLAAVAFAFAAFLVYVGRQFAAPPDPGGWGGVFALVLYLLAAYVTFSGLVAAIVGARTPPIINKRYWRRLFFCYGLALLPVVIFLIEVVVNSIERGRTYHREVECVVHARAPHRVEAIGDVQRPLFGKPCRPRPMPEARAIEVIEHGAYSYFIKEGWWSERLLIAERGPDGSKYLKTEPRDEPGNRLVGLPECAPDRGAAVEARRPASK